MRGHKVQVITELQIRLIDCSPYQHGVRAMPGLSLPHTHGTQHAIGTTADAGASHASVGKTFLAQLLTRHLPHLEHLSLQQSCWMLSMEDFHAIGTLRELQSLEIFDLVTSPYNLVVQYSCLGASVPRFYSCFNTLLDAISRSEYQPCGGGEYTSSPLRWHTSLVATSCTLC